MERDFETLVETVSRLVERAPGDSPSSPYRQRFMRAWIGKDVQDLEAIERELTTLH